MTKILVTTDFSTNSKAGIRFAMQLASQTPCELVFYHAFEQLAPTAWSKEDAHTFSQNATNNCKDQLVRFLNKVFKQLKTPVSNYKYDVEMGLDVDNLIINYAKNIDADFICMSTRGAGTLKKLIGTNASKLVNASPIPVIVVPQRYRIQPITKVAYSTDLENFEEEIKIVEKLSASLNAQVHVYHYYYPLHEMEIKQTYEMVQQKHASKNIVFHSPQLHIEYALAENLQHLIKKEKPSILVMFTKLKHNWFERFFLSNNTAEMTYDINVPLWAFRK
jgi:nucleotide-binding universal stress UspA family protein